MQATAAYIHLVLVSDCTGQISFHPFFLPVPVGCALATFITFAAFIANAVFTAKCHLLLWFAFFLLRLDPIRHR